MPGPAPVLGPAGDLVRPGNDDRKRRIVARPRTPGKLAPYNHGVRLLAVVLLSLPLASGRADVVVTTLGDGGPLRGISLTADQRGVSVHSAEGQVIQVAAGQVVEVATLPAPAAPPGGAWPFEVELTDGSRLRGAIENGPDASALRVRSAMLRGTDGFLDLRIEQVRAVRRVAGADVPGSSRLVRIAERDAAYRLSGARIEGFVAAFLATHVEMEREGTARREIPYSDLAALFVDNPEIPRPQELHVVARLADGSAIVLTEDFRVAAGVVSGTLPSGPLLRVSVANLVSLSFQGRSFVHLSDLTPAAIRREPFFPLPDGPAREALLDFVCPVRFDRSPDGAPITLEGRRYFKGIGVRPTTEIRYEIEGKYARFEAECGIDDEVLGPGYGRAAGQGSVVFTVTGDGKRLFETPPVFGGKPPQKIRVDITGVQSLTLGVSLVPKELMPKGQADSPELDNAVWARPLLIR